MKKIKEIIFWLFLNAKYRKHPWSFWKEFWTNKMKEVGTVLKYIGFVVSIYFLALWIPASIVASGANQPNWFYMKREVSLVETITNKIEVIPSKTYIAKIPVFKKGIKTESSIQNMQQDVKAWIQNEINSSMFDEITNIILKDFVDYHIKCLDEWREDDKYDSEEFDKWCFDKIEKRVSMKFVKTSYTNFETSDVLKTNSTFYILQLNDMPICVEECNYNGRDWWDGHWWMLFIYGCLALVIMIFRTWFSSNYNRLK